VSTLNSEEGSNWNIVPLNEDNFDFELRQAEEKRYLELQEVVIPGKKRGSPYVKGEQVIQPRKFAKKIVSQIMSKAIKYQRGATQPLDLLIYNTHWRFLPNKSVLQLVCHELHNIIHPFSRIYFFTRHNPSEGQVVNICPSTDLLKGFNREEAKGNVYVNFDPGSGEPFTHADKVGVRFALSPTVAKQFREIE